jgi:hypothetical protein
MDEMKKTTEARFWEKVDIRGEDECWDWTAGKNKKGYGEFSSNLRDGKHTHAHQIAWILCNKKEIPDRLCICHSCDNTACCNPKHLFLGTNQENTQDKMSKGRWSSRFLYGKEHPQHGENSKIHKLTENDVKTIREMWASGKHTLRGLASQFGVSHGVINNINHGRKWAWLR